MGMWRCPNCGTAQADSTRCFLCERSSTSCGTCTHFRGSVVGGLGYCGLDKNRSPLTGAERRGCWTVADSAGDLGLFSEARLSLLDHASDGLSAAPEISARPTAG
jgi:hypothetical protein